MLFSLKFFATTISYGSGASGGLFMPTLFMGAMLGGLIGALAEKLFPGIGAASTGAYALVGMGAFFAAVIRAPFTSIIMIFEMTRDYKIILPVMIANIVAYAISSRFHEGSIYENISEQDGVHLPTREDNEVLESLLVEDAMITTPITLNANLTVKEAVKKIRDTEISGYPVLKNGVLIGMVSTSDVGSHYARRNGDFTIEKICTKKLIKIYPDQSLLVAFHKLQKHQISRLTVVSRINDKRLVGIITPEDIVNKFGFHIQEESKKDLIGNYEKELKTEEEVEDQKREYRLSLSKELLQKELTKMSLKDK
jgi:CIC family chloride channel protein